MSQSLCCLNCCSVRSTTASMCKYLTRKQKAIRKSHLYYANWMKLRSHSYRHFCLEVCNVGLVTKLCICRRGECLHCFKKRFVCSLGEKESSNPVLHICLCCMSLHSTDIHIKGILGPCLRAGIPDTSQNFMLRLVNMSPQFKTCVNLCGNQRNCNW